MKYLIRSFLFNVFAIWFTSQIIPAFTVHGSWQSIIGAGLVLSILMLIIRPILKILFIPINIITFGLLSWFVNVIVIYLLTALVNDVSISTWTFNGLNLAGFIIPKIYFGYFASLVLTTFSITFFANLLHDVSES
jgi:putative membrane protein